VLSLQQVADRGHDFSHDTEMAVVIEDAQFEQQAGDNARDTLRGER